MVTLKLNSVILHHISFGLNRAIPYLDLNNQITYMRGSYRTSISV